MNVITIFSLSYIPVVFHCSFCLVTLPKQIIGVNVVFKKRGLKSSEFDFCVTVGLSLMIGKCVCVSEKDCVERGEKFLLWSFSICLKKM